jgi:RNA polymerase sigma-70 factor (ECF subfamily)
MDARSARSPETPPSVEDRRWTEGVRAGDVAAFKTMFDACHDAVWVAIHRYVRNAAVADEITQDVFAWVWRHRATWDVRETVLTYLMSAARHRALNYLKREGVTARWESKAVVDVRISGMGSGPSTPEEDVRAHELGAALEGAVAQLPARRREAFTLRTRDGLTNAQVARVMGVSVKCVELQLAKAIKTLRVALKDVLG